MVRWRDPRLHITNVKVKYHTTIQLYLICHIRNILVWRQGRFSDPRGRLPGGRDLDAGHRDPQPEEVLHPRCPLQARRALAEQGHGADLCCRLQACHPSILILTLFLNLVLICHGITLDLPLQTGNFKLGWMQISHFGLSAG